MREDRSGPIKKIKNNIRTKIPECRNTFRYFFIIKI